eukprot:m.81692 g.81692  ORF g.81692 m.81692 type:complete len:209 (+) comp19494_c0_seq4:90-716(+)
MAAPATRLPIATPWWVEGWKALEGAPALTSIDGAIYYVEPPGVRNQHPSYISQNDNTESCVFREGSDWFWSGVGGGRYFKYARVPHQVDSDPNLPPTTPGWLGNFDIASGRPMDAVRFRLHPTFSTAVANVQRLWAPSAHHSFPLPAKDWIYAVLLCGHRAASEPADHTVSHVECVLPDLPWEMWFNVFRSLRVGDMVPRMYPEPRKS